MESRNPVKFAVLTVTLLLVAMCASCSGRYIGGGYIDSLAGAPQRATIGFIVDAGDPDPTGFPQTVTGQVQFNDLAVGVQLHIDQMSAAPFASGIGTIFNLQAVVFNYFGTYTCPQGSGDVILGFGSHLQAGPMGEPNLDAVMVNVLTGPYAGYFNSGLLQRGTIRFTAL
jgi:hypothetical protein